MMERRLKEYLNWKRSIGKHEINTTSTTKSGPSIKTDSSTTAPTVTNALRRKDEERQKRNLNRRRIRGGGTIGGFDKRRESTSTEGSIVNHVDSDTSGSTGVTGKGRERIGLLVGESELRVEVDSVRS